MRKTPLTDAGIFFGFASFDCPAFFAHLRGVLGNVRTPLHLFQWQRLNLFTFMEKYLLEPKHRFFDSDTGCKTLFEFGTEFTKLIQFKVHNVKVTGSHNVYLYQVYAFAAFKHLLFQAIDASSPEARSALRERRPDLRYLVECYVQAIAEVEEAIERDPDWLGGLLCLIEQHGAKVVADILREIMPSWDHLLDEAVIHSGAFADLRPRHKGR